MFNVKEEHELEDLAQGGVAPQDVKEDLLSSDSKLEAMMTDARKEAVENLKDQDMSGVDIWISEVGFISPFPDRVNRVDIATLSELLEALLDHMEESIPGTVFTLTEELGPSAVALMQDHLHYKIGYIPNPDLEFATWHALVQGLPTIHPLDIESHFEPIHLPQVIPAQSASEVEESDNDEA